MMLSAQTNSDTLAQITAALLATGTKNAEPSRFKDFCRLTIEEGGAPDFRVESLFYHADPRLLEVPRPALLGAMGTPCAMLYNRPGKAHWADGCMGLPAVEVASLLIKLERLGFGTDPEVMVAALRPDLKKKRRLTEAELNVVLHKKTRHRAVVRLEAEPGSAPSRVADYQTARGYGIQVGLDAGGRALTLVVRGPRYKQPRPSS